MRNSFVDEVSLFTELIKNSVWPDPVQVRAVTKTIGIFLLPLDIGENSIQLLINSYLSSAGPSILSTSLLDQGFQ
jgi:hypothetical protein